MALEIHEAPERRMISRFTIEESNAGYVKTLLLNLLDQMGVEKSGYVVLTPATLDLVGDEPR
jgi:hypothetical protein